MVDVWQWQIERYIVNRGSGSGSRLKTDQGGVEARQCPAMSSPRVYTRFRLWHVIDGVSSNSEYTSNVAGFNSDKQAGRPCAGYSNVQYAYCGTMYLCFDQNKMHWCGQWLLLATNWSMVAVMWYMDYGGCYNGLLQVWLSFMGRYGLE